MIRATFWRALSLKRSPRPAISRDEVALTKEEQELVNRMARHIGEEDLEHDELGMKQHRHESQPTWKDAEVELNRKQHPSDHPAELPAKK